jgi:general secretion pathway protein G
MMKTKRNNARKQKGGFTLVEIMLVVVIIGIILAVAVPAIAPFLFTARSTQVEGDIRTLSLAVDQFEMTKGQYPASLQDVAQYVRDGIPTDPWGGDYVYAKELKGYVIYSKGQDGNERLTGKEKTP